MTTLTTMIALVRQELHDEDASNYRWTDAVLTRHIDHANSEFSQYLPYECANTYATTPNSRDVSLVALNLLVAIFAVEYKTGLFPPAYQRFSFFNNILTILSDEIPDGSNCKLYFGNIHSINVSTSTVPAQHEHLIILGATGLALVEWASYAVNRVNVGGAATARTYRSDGEARLLLFRREIRALGRQGKVRVRQLYTPYTPIVSKTIVTGP